MAKENHKAFTLVELLVVIFIIANLLGLILPVLNRARQQAKKIVCLSNMRQMGLGLQSYLANCGDHLPDSSCYISDPNKYWLAILSRHLGSELMSRCPADTARNFVDWSLPLERQAMTLRWSSFALNSLLDSKCPRYNGKYNNVSKIPNPQYCIYVAESPSHWTATDHIHPEYWFYNINLAKGQIAWDRHLGKSNYLFTDGHTETLKVENTYNWPGACYWFPESAPGWPDEE